MSLINQVKNIREGGKKIKILFFILLSVLVFDSYSDIPRGSILTLPQASKSIHSLQNKSRLPDFQNPLNIISEQEKQAGRLFFISIQRFSNLNKDSVIQQYIYDLGNLLVNYANIINPHYMFFVIDEPSINAFAGPAGYIGVHSGLLLSASSEGEVASVLAHEIAHTKQKHLHRLIENQPGYASPLVVFGLLLAGIVTNSPYVIPGMFVLQAKQIEESLKYLRQFEDEADSSGLQILQSAGFSGQYAVAFMERLSKKDFSLDSSEYLRTHPITRKRIANLRNRVSDKTLYAPTSEFDLIQARLSYLTKLPTEASFSDYQQQYVDFLSLLEQSANVKAMALWQKLSEQTKENSLLFNLVYMRLLLNTNQISQANQQMNKLRRFYPNHLEVLKLQTQLYIKEKKSNQAENNLLTYTNEKIYNLYQAQLWKFLEELYFVEEKKVELFYAKAQHQYNLGFLRKALEYLDNAIKSAQLENRKPSEITKLISTYRYWHKQLYINSSTGIPSPH